MKHKDKPNAARRTRQGLLALVLGGLAALNGPGPARAQAGSAPILSQSFETGDLAWITSGAGAKAAITTETDSVKEGKGALKFDYVIQKGLSILGLPTPDGKLAGAHSLRFWVKTDYATSLALVLQEKNGGRYVASCALPGGVWQQVEIAESDFLLSSEPDAPKDPDGKLDMDAVENIALIDLGQFLAQLPEAAAKPFRVSNGPHTLLLDDVVVSADKLPANATLRSGKASDADAEVVLDKFARPQATWTTVGEVRPAIVSNKPLTSAGLRADYKQLPGKIAGLSKDVPLGRLVGMKTLRFTAATAHPSKFLVQVEEIGGGKYNVTLDINPGANGPEAKEYAIGFNEFIAGEDSKDANHKLDIDQINKVLFLDVTPFYTQKEADATLWLTGLRGTAK